MARLEALLPKPHLNLTRLHGVDMDQIPSSTRDDDDRRQRAIVRA